MHLTPTQWKPIVCEFENRWNFLHFLCTSDGKDVVMQCPARGGSYYLTTPSLGLLAVCNSNYEFLLYEIGDAGQQSDGSVYSNSDIGFAINENLLSFPAESTIREFIEKYPYVILKDDTFGLIAYLLKPYP